MNDDLLELWRQPLRFVRIFWPSVTLYREQRMIMESVVNDDETVVHAGNMLGV